MTTKRPSASELCQHFKAGRLASKRGNQATALFEFEAVAELALAGIDALTKERDLWIDKHAGEWALHTALHARLTELQERNRKLEVALIGVTPSNRKPGICWCGFGIDIIGGGHTAHCELAQAALRGES